MLFTRIFVVGAMAISGTTAATCYGKPREFADYHELARSVCQQGPHASMENDWSTSSATYDGNMKRDCEAAFEEIFYQCIHFGGKSGGEWELDEDGVYQKYSIDAWSKAQ